MKPMLILLGIFALISITVLAILSHHAFGLWRHVSKERIQSSPNYRDGMFQNQEPTPQFTGNTNPIKAMWSMLIRHDSARVPNEPIQAVKTDLQNLPTDSDWLVWFGHLALLENGQYNANWKYIHTTPEDLEKVVHDLQAQQVFTVHHDKYALSVHPWYEPDSVAQDIASRNSIRLLDAPIGTVVKF